MMKLSAGVAPVFLEPLDVGLEAAGRSHEGGRAHRRSLRPARDGDRPERAVRDVQIDRFGVVHDLDAQPFGGDVVARSHRATAAEEEGVGAAEAERAAERRLPAHALLAIQRQNFFRLADHEAGELLVGLAAGDP